MQKSVITVQFSVITVQFSVITVQFSVITVQFSVITVQFSVHHYEPIKFELGKIKKYIFFSKQRWPHSRSGKIPTLGSEFNVFMYTINK